MGKAQINQHTYECTQRRSNKSIKTKIIDVDVQKIHDNINRRDAETISDILYDALDELGYIDGDNLMTWSWNLEVSVEVKEK